MKRIRIMLASLGLVLAAPIMLWVVSAQAQSFQSGDAVTVPASETVDSSLYSAGNNTDIAGTVNGDVFCVGQTVTISGTVNGDVICAAQTLEISGKVTGDVRLAGQTVSISGQVGLNATVFAQTFTTTATGDIGRDVAGGAQTANFNGKVGRDLTMGAENMTVNSMVGRNIDSVVTQLTLTDNADVGGNVAYTSQNDLNQASGAVIAGEVTKTVPEEPQKNNGAIGVFGIALFSLLSLGIFAAMLLTSLVIVLAIPQRLQSSSDLLVQNWPRTLLVGFLAHLIVPIVFIALLVTLLGIPLAIGGGLLWLVVMFLTGPFSAYAVGRLILQKHSDNAIWYMMLGAVILLVLYWIPFVNLFVLLAVGLFGTGMVLREFVPAKPQYRFAAVKTNTKK